MRKKEEIMFNAKALVSAWLSINKITDVKDLKLEFNNDTTNKITPCTVENCGEILGEQLWNNKEKYTKITLTGEVNKTRKEFGYILIND